MPEKLKLIPREEPEKSGQSTQKGQQKTRKKNARTKAKTAAQHKSGAYSATGVKPKKTPTQYPHLQKQQAIELSQENKKIKAVGYKLVNYASSIAKLSQQEIYELIHDAQRSVLYLQKHHRKMIKKKRKNNPGR